MNTGAIEYMAQNKLPVALLAILENISVRINNASDWCEWMDQQGIVKPRHRKIVTEGALMGGLLDQGIPSDFSIISDIVSGNAFKFCVAQKPATKHLIKPSGGWGKINMNFSVY